MKQPEISYVTWSPTGIRIVYAGAMVVHVTAEDLYPLAVPTRVASLIQSERRSVPLRST
jgi:hypothetical protein